MSTNRREFLAPFVSRHSVVLLRVSLSVVFIWFGALKLFGTTPVGDLVAATIPFVPADLLLPALGVFELVIGVALLVGWRLSIVATLIAAHLAGTFLVLVTQPEVAFQGNNPLQLTVIGEFVVKNVVLITAALVLATAGQPVTAPAESPAGTG